MYAVCCMHKEKIFSHMDLINFQPINHPKLEKFVNLGSPHKGNQAISLSY